MLANGSNSYRLVHFARSLVNRDGNRTELELATFWIEPNQTRTGKQHVLVELELSQTRSHRELKRNKNPVDWVLKSSQKFNLSIVDATNDFGLRPQSKMTSCADTASNNNNKALFKVSTIRG